MTVVGLFVIYLSLEENANWKALPDYMNLVLKWLK